MQKGFAGVVILVVVLILAGLGGAYYFVKSQSPKPQTPQITSTPSSIPDASREPNSTGETANWKTYTSNYFTVKYPQTSEITEYLEIDKEVPDLLMTLYIDLRSSSPDVQSPPLNSIRVWNNLGVDVTDFATRDKWCNLLQKELTGQLYCTINSNNIKETLINGNKAFVSADSNTKEETFYIPYGKYIYQITLINFKLEQINGEYKSLPDTLPRQILSTFKFIEPSSTPVATIAPSAKLSSCAPCPLWMPFPPDFCKDGTIVPGEKDKCGCQRPPTCKR